MITNLSQWSPVILPIVFWEFAAKLDRGGHKHPRRPSGISRCAPEYRAWRWPTYRIETGWNGSSVSAFFWAGKRWGWISWRTWLHCLLVPWIASRLLPIKVTLSKQYWEGLDIGLSFKGFWRLNSFLGFLICLEHFYMTSRFFCIYGVLSLTTFILQEIWRKRFVFFSVPFFPSELNFQW